MRLSRAGRAAEVADRATIAGVDVFHFASVTNANGGVFKMLSISSRNRLPPLKAGRPMNSLQGNTSPIGGDRKEGRPPPQGEMSHIRRRACGARIAIRILAKLATTRRRPVFWYSSSSDQRGQKIAADIFVGRFYVAGSLPRATHRIQHASGDAALVEEFTVSTS